MAPDHRIRDDIKPGMSVKVSLEKDDPPEKWIDTTVSRIVSNDEIVDHGIQIIMADGRLGYCKEIIDPNCDISESELEKLIANHETNTFELKSSFQYDMENQKKVSCLRDQIVKIIAAFMNSDGGIICIGVDDSGNILGLEHDYEIITNDPNKTPKDVLSRGIHDYVAEKLKNIPTVNTLFRPYIIPYKRKEVCIIQIKKSSVPVFVEEECSIQLCNSRRKNTTRWVFYVRAGVRVIEYSPYEVKSYWEHNKKSLL